MRIETKILLGLGVLSLSGIPALTADAGTILRLSDGIAPAVTILDNGAGDDDPTLGIIEFSGAVGTVFTVNVTTGLSNPFIGSPSLPELELNSINVNSSASGTLDIMFTTTGLVGPLPSGTATLDVGGRTDGTFGITSYVDTSNADFGLATPTATVSSVASGSFAGQDSSVVALAAPYSATLFATITHNGPLDTTGFSAAYSIVPEPGSLALLGLGGLLVARRRR